MKKFTAWAILVSFSWLQLYQICDASEDMIEVVSARLDTLSHSRPSLHSPAAPEDDVDTNIPFVAGEVLHHGQIQIASDTTRAGLVPLALERLEPAVLIAPAHDLSPPGHPTVAAETPIAQYAVDRSPAHSLAPPQA